MKKTILIILAFMLIFPFIANKNVYADSLKGILRHNIYTKGVMFSEGYKIAKKYHKNYYFLCKSWYIKNYNQSYSGIVMFRMSSGKATVSNFKYLPEGDVAIASCLQGVEIYKEIHKK